MFIDPGSRELELTQCFLIILSKDSRLPTKKPKDQDLHR